MNTQVWNYPWLFWVLFQSFLGCRVKVPGTGSKSPPRTCTILPATGLPSGGLLLTSWASSSGSQAPLELRPRTKPGLCMSRQQLAESHPISPGARAEVQERHPRAKLSPGRTGQVGGASAPVPASPTRSQIKSELTSAVPLTLPCGSFSGSGDWHSGPGGPGPPPHVHIRTRWWASISQQEARTPGIWQKDRTEWPAMES